MALQENRHHPIPSNDLSLFSLLYSHKIRGYPYGSVCQWGTPTGNGNFIWSIRSWTIRKNGAIILHRAPWGPWPPATWWVSSWDVVHRAAAAGCHRSSSSAPGSKGDPPAGNWGVGLSIELLLGFLCDIYRNDILNE